MERVRNPVGPLPCRKETTMAEKETEVQTTEEKAPVETVDDPLFLTFEKAHIFEGKEYHEIDLRGIRKLTIRDAIDIQKKLVNKQEEAPSVLTETTTAFARELAAKATGKPIEFFAWAKRGVSRRISRAVFMFLSSAQVDTDSGTLELDAPYEYEGEVYKTLDLSGVADLNSMNESAAENQMAREGFIITETSLNFLYPCILAGMATGKPTKFFTGLPIIELPKIKALVNASGFFE